MEAIFDWVQNTGLAITVRDSLLLTSTLSAVHLLGFTVVTGGALVANLRLLGVLLPNRPIADIVLPAARGIGAGLAISITTGLLLFAPRAPDASANGTFRLKMLLLVSAVAFHFTVHVRASRRLPAASGMLRAIGAIGFLLWTGLAAAGAAYILFE
jgi:hypothetical protein